MRTCPIQVLALSAALLFSPSGRARSADAPGANDTQAESELSYKSYIHSTKRIKCLYGYAADKTGDHAAAIVIFEDCIDRWNDVYSMIWLAQIYESGVGAPINIEKATALIKRGAQLHDDTGYPRLARYHYGVALAEGRGVPADIGAARKWLRLAADEGLIDAAVYLQSLDDGVP